MSLAASRDAIGAVSELLRTLLTTNTSVSTVDVGRPAASANMNNGPKYNLFLYHISFDEHLRNYSLDDGQQPPLWLVLHYLITAFDESEQSDSVDAHELLGEGMLALQELGYLTPTESALNSNPESLKITFANADAELISKLMQNSDDQYRVSAAFQIRPVMIAPSQPPTYGLPVQMIGPDNQGVMVIPSIGPQLTHMAPEKFSAGDTLRLFGKNLDSQVETVLFNDTVLPVSGANNGYVMFDVPDDQPLSAGSIVIKAVLTAKGQTLASNAVLGHFQPTVQTAIPSALVDNAGLISGDLQINGLNLGDTDDSIYVSFYRNGATALMIEATGTANQTTLNLSVSTDDAIDPADYFIVVSVNGEQAATAPSVSWVV